MSLIDRALQGNVAFAEQFNPANGGRPKPRIAVVTCMDPRLSDLPGILGLPQADLDVIRTGGPAVTEDVLGELIVSTRVLGTTEILLLNHTGCGFTTSTDQELNARMICAHRGLVAGADAVLRLHRSSGEHAGTDREGTSPSMDREGRTGAWLCV